MLTREEAEAKLELFLVALYDEGWAVGDDHIELIPREDIR